MGPKCGASCHPSGTENLEKAPRYLKNVDPCFQSAVINVSTMRKTLHFGLSLYYLLGLKNILTLLFVKH